MLQCVARASSVLTLFLLGPGLALLGPTPAKAGLVLNEILYDPAGADEGQEFVEIWNPDSVALPLAGVEVEAGDGARPDAWVVVWRGEAGDSAPARGAYLIRGVNLLGAIQNGPDAVRLTRAGATLDLVGYGDLEDPVLFEGESAVDAASGQSLARVQDGVDTNANRADWAAEPEPTPGSANHPDLRLRFSRAGASVMPEVAWPGDLMQWRARVRNSGRLAVDAGRWAIEVDRGDSVGGGAWSLIGSARGVAIAPGESALVAMQFRAPSAGPSAIRSRLVGLADTTLAVIRVLAGPAVVNEIAFRDAGAGEWVELWFREAIADAGEILIADGTAAPVPLDRGPQPLPVRAHALLVVAQDPALVRARFGLPDSVVLGVAGGWPSLNDAGSDEGPADRVRVLDSHGFPSDAAPYYPRASARNGSLERLSVDLPTAAAGSWAETIDAMKGTPGMPNSMRAPGAGAGGQGRLLVASAPVLRRRGGELLPLVLRATGHALGRRLTVRVHDLLGRSLRTLVEGQRFFAEGAFLWDGRDGRGAPVRSGLYVVRAEALPEEGLPARSSSLPIAVPADVSP